MRVIKYDQAFISYLISIFVFVIVFCSPVALSARPIELRQEIELGRRGTVVDARQFEFGNFWVWLYYEFDQTTQNWKPYLEERYTVTRVKGRFLTIEMSSSPPESRRKSLAHHKFEIDFKKCEMEKLNPTYRHWTLKFYTRTDSADWQLVSNTHPNLVFTEKFNCSKVRSPKLEQIDFLGESRGVFRKQQPLNHETSWYFLDHPELRAIQWQKLFKPDDLYKAELVKWGRVR